MATQAINYDFENLTEQIKVNMTENSAAEDNSKYNFMVAIATVTWLLLSCLSAFIYCCNYWELFAPSARLAREELSEQSEQSQLEQQSMLLSQVSEVSST